MALNPRTKWPLATTAPTASYPYGSSKDESVPGAKDGTPYVKDRADDVFGFQQALLQAAEITPSENPDTALNKTSSQYMQALLALAMAGTTFIDSGAADAYVLSTSNGMPAPAAYIDNMIMEFDALNANTGASTVNVEGLGDKALTVDDAPLVLGDITAGERIQMQYHSAGDDFHLVRATAIGWEGLPVGSVVNQVHSQIGTVSTASSTIPEDDTIPQITEGTEVMALVLTPKATTHQLLVNVHLNVSVAGTNKTVIAALFQDAISDAVSAVSRVPVNIKSDGLELRIQQPAGTTSPITFRVRIGSADGSTVTLNGQNGIRLFGGVNISGMSITEIKA